MMQPFYVCGEISAVFLAHFDLVVGEAGRGGLGAWDACCAVWEMSALGSWGCFAVEKLDGLRRFKTNRKEIGGPGEESMTGFCWIHFG